MKNPIIPSNPLFYGRKDGFDYKAICVYAALGFFLDDETYHQGLKVVKPNAEFNIENGSVSTVQSTDNPWRYQPEDISLSQSIELFAEQFHEIISAEPEHGMILPLSGGLDSRTLAAAARHTGKKPFTFSYKFYLGHDETHYGEKIAKYCGFKYQSLEVPSGYLWKSLNKFAEINDCYSEFTHPRQAAFLTQYQNFGNRFLLGHWGDVLFDDMGVPDSLGFEDQVKVLMKKVVKKGGLEIADSLWKFWELPGEFCDYLEERLRDLLAEIPIENSANARIRAFKSTHWAPRWTSTNLRFYAAALPISVPYYHNQLCNLICRIPEKWLSARQIQIEYLKKYAPDLASITWQSQRPFNVNNYHLNRFPYNLPYRLWSKLKKTPTQRNWELQFNGDDNDMLLKEHLFNPIGDLKIPKEINMKFYQKFRESDPVFFSHSVSMLLTLNLYRADGKYNV